MTLLPYYPTFGQMTFHRHQCSPLTCHPYFQATLVTIFELQMSKLNYLLWYSSSLLMAKTLPKAMALHLWLNLQHHSCWRCLMNQPRKCHYPNPLFCLFMLLQQILNFELGLELQLSFQVQLWQLLQLLLRVTICMPSEGLPHGLVFHPYTCSWLHSTLEHSCFLQAPFTWALCASICPFSEICNKVNFHQWSEMLSRVNFDFNEGAQVMAT